MRNLSQYESQFRRFTLEKLQALHAVTQHSSPIVSSASISNITGVKQRELGGILSSLARTRVDNKPIIYPVARSREAGMLWRLNDDLLSRNETRKITEKILEEARPFLQESEK